eukprot:3369650-Karenia_brevis.AAC.1
MPPAVNSKMLSKPWLPRSLKIASPSIFSLTLGLSSFSAWLSVHALTPKCRARTNRFPPARCTAQGLTASSEITINICGSHFLPL